MSYDNNLIQLENPFDRAKRIHLSFVSDTKIRDINEKEYIGKEREVLTRKEMRRNNDEQKSGFDGSDIPEDDRQELIRWTYLGKC